MKQCLLFLAILMTLNGSAITRSNPIDPVVFSLNLSKDQAWQRITDLFVSNSVPIKFMDKSSGLIQSDKIGLGSHYALKTADDSVSWVLCAGIRSPEGEGFYLFPEVINAELQIYLRETGEGKVLLSVNLMNLTANARDLNAGVDRDFAIQSSKRLEQLIGNFLNGNEKIPTLNFDPPLATFGEPPSQVKKRQALAKFPRNEAGKDGEGIGLVALLIGIVAAALLFGKTEE
jgi:hypothetical protein